VRTGEFFFQSSKTNDDDVITLQLKSACTPIPYSKIKGETTIVLLHSNYFVILQYISSLESFFVDPFCVYESGEVLDYRRLKLKRIPLIWLKCLGNRSKGT
jgi:hypothetical protein